MPITDPAVYWGTLWVYIDAYNRIIDNGGKLTAQENELFTALVDEVYRLSEPLDDEPEWDDCGWE